MGLSKLNRGLSTRLWGLGAQSNVVTTSPPPPPPPAPSYPAPWAYYPLSANANDASGNGRNLTGTGSSYSGSGGVVDGYATGAMNRTIAESASSSTWTMCAWVYANNANLYLSWDGASIQVTSDFGMNFINMPGSNSIVTSTWINASVIFNGSQLISYIDGTQVGITSSIIHNGNAFLLENYGNRACEVGLWKDTILTALEIAAVYTQGDAGNPLVS